jgi:hypothetical protein
LASVEPAPETTIRASCSYGAWWGVIRLRSPIVSPHFFTRFAHATIGLFGRRDSNRSLLGCEAMDETKNASETEASQTPAGHSDGCSDETKSLSGTTGSQPPSDSPSDFSDVDPAKIGRYRFIRRLGQGGFGRVYLAHDDDLDRAVAIKVPSPERITRSEDLEAFLIEAKVLAKLDQPTSSRFSM